MDDSTVTPEPRLPSNRLGYQPALDGMRAFAVTLVVLFHYPWRRYLFGSNPVHGGFLGVDVFFVLSGFLITTLLLQEHVIRGVVSLRRFYARRALRLLPAFYVLWLIALVMHFTLSVLDSDHPSVGGLLGSLFYVANWVNIANPKALGILGPTWSLAIEEQFYFVWPVILIALLSSRLRLRTIAWITAGAAAASALYRTHYWYSHVGDTNFTNYYFRLTLRTVPQTSQGTFAHRLDVWNRIYFGSFTRADALLAGCVTAMVLMMLLPRLSARARARLSVASGIALLVVIAIISQSVATLSGWLPVWGFPLLELSIAVLIAGLVAAPRGLLARFFALPPFAWLGRRSYAVYLFHLVVFKYCSRPHVPLSPPLSFVFQMVVILLAAELSYRVIEAPMLRRKRRFETNVTVASQP